MKFDYRLLKPGAVLVVLAALAATPARAQIYPMQDVAASVAHPIDAFIKNGTREIETYVFAPHGVRYTYEKQTYKNGSRGRIESDSRTFPPEKHLTYYDVFDDFPPEMLVVDGAVESVQRVKLGDEDADERKKSKSFTAIVHSAADFKSVAGIYASYFEGTKDWTSKNKSEVAIGSSSLSKRTFTFIRASSAKEGGDIHGTGSKSVYYTVEIVPENGRARVTLEYSTMEIDRRIFIVAP
jgi:hypothetical protein